MQTPVQVALMPDLRAACAAVCVCTTCVFVLLSLQIRAVPEPYLAELTHQMLLGLSFLHETARICHRDVKPSNLLLSSSGQLKISDFGTSSQLSNSMSKCLSWVGTVTYMSPERIKGDCYSFNTDVWSLGLLVLECALGRYPYPPQQQQVTGSDAPVAALPPQKLGFWELLEYIGECSS